ncbi:hypothetical protein IMCC1933_30640 [Rhodobacteraceae bacterium IMCC1933]|nr:hypothetical protein [Rhodobacteraceae bacterium IMCC1923]MDP4069492.1 hypothetical protein [Rhodobacteraceae bacterium IMCC1933]MDP4072624.1 hypothetical protein [Rhodobacteraceae bacterium IMCC1909]
MITISKFLKDWETKNAKILTKTGSFSMMALSLAACGGGGGGGGVSTLTPPAGATPVVDPVTSDLTIWNDTVVGTTGEDTVTGLRIDTVQTFNSGDSITLGDGIDNLSATLNEGTVTPAAITGVENVMFVALGPATIDFDNVSGVTSLISRGSSATLVVDDIQEIPTSISVNNNTAAQTFIFKDTAVSGNTDELTLQFDGVGGVVNVGSELVGDGDIEIFTIIAAGGASDLGAGNGFGADAITITVNATSDLDLGSTAQFIASTNFDASDSTAAVTAVFAAKTTASETAVTIKGGAGADKFDIRTFTAEENFGDLIVDMGDGNDTLYLGEVADTDTGSSIKGGSGDGDILIISGNALAAEVNSQISEFEILNIETTGLTQDADNFGGTIFGTAAAIAEMRIDNLAGGSIININHDVGTSLTANLKTDTPSDALTINIGGTSGNVTLESLVPSTQYETVTVNSQGTAENTLSGVGAVINNMTFTGDTAITVSSTDNIVGVVDFTNSNQNNTVMATDTTAQTISFGSGDDTITTGVVASSTQIINGGSGNDTISAGIITTAGVLELNGEAGSDIISVAAMTGADTASSATINGGTGVDFITLDSNPGNSVDVVSTATTLADSDKITGFTTVTDNFDYNGNVLNDTATTITVVSGATLAGGIAADSDATVYIVTTPLTDAAAADMVKLVAETTVSAITSQYATFEVSLAAALGTIDGLDTALSASETVLLNIDDGSNSVVLKVTNTDKTTANTLIAAELDLVAIMVGADDLVAGDFI